MKQQFLFSLILCLYLLSNNSYGQDVWLQNHFSPSSGCSLSSSETVTVLINNNSGATMPSNTINVYYTVDGGSLTNQPLSSNLTAGASWNFFFSVKANLSACGAHVIKVWVSRAGDVNHLNDTLRWTVQNDCPVVPGSVSGSATICKGDNDGVLALTGWSYGIITGWQSSTDGNNWTNLNNTTAAFNYTDVTQTTSYRVQIDGRYCPDATSATGTLTTTAPQAGTIAGSDSFDISASGQLTLSGASGAVNFWESSTDKISWTTITNTTSTFNYSGITQTTWYRANTDGGICQDVYSDTAVVHIYPPVTGVSDEILGNSDLKFFPNPADQFLEISLDGALASAAVTIYNNTGNVVTKEQWSQIDGTSKKVIDTHLLASGIYFITISSDKGSRSAKFVKR